MMLTNISAKTVATTMITCLKPIIPRVVVYRIITKHAVLDITMKKNPYGVMNGSIRTSQT